MSAAAEYWEDDPGGIFNPPPVEYNPIYFGYGSYDNVTYNKIDLQDGRNMEMERTNLYDNTGQYIADAWASGIGRVDGERDGGLIAGSIYKFIIDGEETWMTYAWSVNTKEGGRQSGWIDVRALSPYTDIVGILTQTKRDRLALFEDETQHTNYEEYVLQETRLPDYMEEYYLDPYRSASYTAGKAKYYYTRDGLLTLINNIPETGSQRYGVGHDIAPVGSHFFRDMTVAAVPVNIYPPSSGEAESHTLNLVWGYVKTSGGDSIFSWVNERALVASSSNLAPQGIASQSSTAYGGVAARAIDENTNGAFSQRSVTHTSFMTQPWWEVKLSSRTNVSNIVLFNREDCCTGRLSDVHVFVSDEPFGDQSLTELLAQENLYHAYLTGTQGAETELSVNSTGRYVRVQLAGNTALSLAEVQVYGIENTEPFVTNLASEGVTAQSATSYGGLADRAIDGNTNGAYNQRSVTHTTSQLQSWWQVDLTQQSAIEQIVLFNRTDSCCSSRLSDVHVFVSEVPFGNQTLDELLAQDNLHHVYVNGELQAETGLSVNHSGRYVRVQLAGTEPLSLAEVQVIGTAVAE